MVDLVFCANFGARNFLWADCLRNSTLAVVRSPRFIEPFARRDLAAYQAAGVGAKNHLGRKVAPGIVTRWYHLTEHFMDSVGDYWIHADGKYLWWTKSLPGDPIERQIPNPTPLNDDPYTTLSERACEPWRNTDLRGNLLAEANIHPMIFRVIYVNGTMIQPKEDNAAYLRRLILGEDTSNWTERPAWKQALLARKHANVTFADASRRTAARMAMAAIEAHERSGRSHASFFKTKDCDFADLFELENFILDLMDEQEGLCALSRLKLLLDSDPGDPSHRYSLDRIDSSRGYMKDNIQLVCGFINSWKGTMRQEKFQKLLADVRAVGLGQNGDMGHVGAEGLDERQMAAAK